MDNHAEKRRDREGFWNKRWFDLGLNKYKGGKGRKFYLLEMFAYPSGDLHMGHLRNYVIGDVLCRYKLMNGFDVMHPVGWDAFGLPAEEAAIKRGIAPDSWTMENIGVSSSTLKKMGLLYDWDREVVTCRSDYYKFTQWLFIQMYKNNLAYRKKAYVNWCPKCQTVLANEQTEGGVCWRCKSEIEKKELEQWFFRITDYAQKLLDGIDKLEGWPENVRTMQRNWIGRSEGLNITFKIENSSDSIEVFTTRPDTLYGVTFAAVAPESDIASKLTIPEPHRNDVEEYIRKSILKTEIERTSTEKEKDGVFTGLYAVNPANGGRVKIFIADYVLGSYGSGAVMGVPAHDTRDFAFAKKYDIDIMPVIKPAEGDWDFSKGAFTDEGVLIESGKFSGMKSENAVDGISDFIESSNAGSRTVNFRIRDWLVSRQRYWGAPIPMIHCSKCGTVPVPDGQLPVLLPESSEVDFTPKGVSPLASHSEFMNVKCPICGGDAKRDADTMDTFVDSSWYQLRYTDARNENEIFDRKKADELLPVDMYIGGVEHANGHLIYFRFITKVLKDLGYIDADEPASALFNQGMIMDASGQIMSKSKGNAVPVGPFIDKYGCDIARGTELFIGPAGKDAIWSEDGITGMTRFIERFEKFCMTHARSGMTDAHPDSAAERTLFVKLNRTVKQIGEDIESFNHNTALAALMELMNLLYKHEKEMSEQFASGVVYTTLQIASPFLPHLCEELFAVYSSADSVFLTEWPKYSDEYLKDDNITVAVQINGKMRGRVEVQLTSSEDDVYNAALNDKNVSKYLEGMDVLKRIYVKEKLLNIVVKQK